MTTVLPERSRSAPVARMSLSGRHFAVRARAGTLLLEGVSELEASSVPSATTSMDSVGSDKDKRLPAIHPLNGDSFIFIAGDQGDPRPAAFHTAPGQTMRTLRRTVSAALACGVIRAAPPGNR